MSPVAMSLILVLLPGLFAWSAARRIRLATLGPGEPRFSIEGDDFQKRIADTLVYAFGQRKMPYYKWAGIAHILVFAGFMVLTINSVLLWGRGYNAGFDMFGVLSLSN